MSLFWSISLLQLIFLHFEWNIIQSVPVHLYYRIPCFINPFFLGFLSLNILFNATATDFPVLFFNSLRPKPNRGHFADDIFKCIFDNENECISPRISLKFVPRVRINNIPALVQIMAWRRPGDKPLSKPMVVSLLTHICVTQPQWVNGINYPYLETILITRRRHLHI